MSNIVFVEWPSLVLCQWRMIKYSYSKERNIKGLNFDTVVHQLENIFIYIYIECPESG